MASTKKAWAICDICGWRYRYRQMKENSYGLLVCPTDWDGAYDLKNHPQNRSAKGGDDEYIANARPPLNDDRGSLWNEEGTSWEDLDNYWNTV